MKRRAPPIKLLLLLLAGAVINIGVAWGCAAWSQPIAFGDADEFETEVLPWWGMSESQIDYYRALGWSSERGEMHFELDAMAACGFGHVERIVEETSKIENEQSMTFGSFCVFPSHYATEYLSGWPRVSFKGAVLEKNLRAGEMPTLSTAIPLPNNWSVSITGRKRHLPYGILWPGFAINTIFYAVIVWMLFAGPSALSRKRRARRGLCVACGYSLRGGESDVCPECGTSRRTRH